MEIQALRYLGVGTARLDDWTSLATGGLGMQAVDRGAGIRAFRMDDRRQRLVLDSTMPDSTRYFGEPEFISLPADFQSMRRVRLSSVTGKPCLEFKSGTQIDEYRFGISNVAGKPRYFTVFGDEIELAPTPDAAYTIEMVYRKSIPALASNADNWLLTLAPDLYLYGALLESAPYIKEDGRIQTWGLGFTTALNDLNNPGLTSTFNAGPMTVRVSGQVI